MKNIFIGTLVLSCFFFIFRAEAQENFYRDILVSEETVPESVDEESAADAVEQAKRLLLLHGSARKAIDAYRESQS